MSYEDEYNPIYKKKCIYCGVEFETDKRIKKYCCYDHLFAAYRLARYHELIKLTDEERKLREEVLKRMKEDKDVNSGFHQ